MPLSYQQIDQALTARGQPFEVEEKEVHGLKLRTWKAAPASLGLALAGGSRFAERTCIVYEGERLSYADFQRSVASLARRLGQDLGVRKGDRVAIAMRNYPEWCIAFCAIVASGAIAVPLNAWWTGDELEFGLVDSDSRVLIADQERLDRLQPALGRLPLAGVVLARGTATGLVKDFATLAGDTGVAFPNVDIAPDDAATILYTSGTTGKPKGAVLSHRNICNQLIGGTYLGVRALLRAGGRMEDLAQLASTQQCALLPVPLFHVTGCIGVLLNMLFIGGKIVMMYRWDAGKALDLVEQERITMLVGVPTMVWHLLDLTDAAKRDLSSLMAISFGGAPAAPELMRRLRTAFPTAYYSNGYGLTETSTVVSNNSGGDYIAKPDSAGVALPVCDIIAVDDQGRETPRGELGELWIRGPNVVKEYWNRPAETAQSFTDGWFHSGDIGRVDEEGFVYIVDRVKDMIIRGGENVYCTEVEAILMEHPKVKAVAVIGIPHPVLGEEVGAVVQFDPTDPPHEAELLAYVGQKLAAFKVPCRFWMRSEPLPLSPAGKVLKRELRAQVLP